MKLKALIGALAGAGIGAAGWYGLVTYGILRETSWIPVLIGLLTGTGAWLLAEPIAQAWQRGALVMAIALTATYLTQQGTSFALERQFDGNATSLRTILFPDAALTEVSISDVDAPRKRETPPLRFDPPSVPEIAAPTEGGKRLSAADQPNLDSPAHGVDAVPATGTGSAAGDSVDATPGVGVPGPDGPGESAILPPPPLPDHGARGERPPAPDQGMMVALSYAIGMLGAYLLGRGPELRKSPGTDAAG